MRAKNSILLAGICFLFFSCSVNKQVQEKELEEQPNIIFVFADDWGYGDLGCYGSEEVVTPYLDQLAKEGTKFTQFHTTSGVCSPSRSSIITGHFPAFHNVHAHFAGNERNAKRGMPNWLDETLPHYLPSLMQKAGYTTAHFGKWHLGGGGEPHGDLSAPEPKVYGYDETRVWNGNGPTWKGDQHFPTTRFMDDDTLWVQSSSRIVIDETIDFIKRQEGKQKPFFINLWLKDPHTPLWPSDEQKAPFNHLSPDQETYFAVLTDADKHVGRLMKALDQMELRENTIIVFSSDNGPAGYGSALTAGKTGGLKGRKVDVFQGGVNVPFIISWKGHVKEGITDSTSVLSGVDILPTFLDLGGMKELPDNYKVDGESFASVFENVPFKRSKPIFWDWRFSYSNEKPTNNKWVANAVRYGDWKLLVDKKGERKELYNITEDPFEKYDLASDNEDKVIKLNNMINAWIKTLPRKETI
ncbi:sulfatase family protein [Flammeovirga aprica]|uniref:Sulfatase-like hydrolase/transferase n=1 Tax=Flammeovirga aprica JL-4 TaxID=694437 RepID=A0A7X9RU60_9BACT|nr:sulfatase-like hydrolase/transferase [Flammeovirga aprica]NME68717.1 sulfatase-like hydrolase/transferase [Flammeovirga aprica JL-4]